LCLFVGLLACPSGKTESERNFNAEGTEEGKEEREREKGKGGGGDDSLKKEGSLAGWGFGGGGAEDSPTVSRSGVVLDSSGNLILNLNQRTETVNHYMWLADTSNGKVSKFDMRTRQEVARYPSVIGVQCAAGQSPEEGNCTTWSPSTGSYYPSRTAIDSNQDAWIANRGGNNRPGVLTKIAGDESRCVDRNGNRQIDTSRVVNGVVVEVPDDECVLFSTPVCTLRATGNSRYGENEGARALAVDGADRVWVGCYDEQTAYQYNPTNGVHEQGPIPLGLKPYGAIVDGRQNLWMTTRAYKDHTNNSDYFTLLQGIRTEVPYESNAPERTVLGWDRAGNRPEPMTPPGGNSVCTPYGIAIDKENRVWFGSWDVSTANNNGNGIVACFYNHYAPEGTNKWEERCQLSADGYNGGRGIAIDNEGRVYMSSTSTGRLTRFRWNEAEGRCEFVPMRGPNNPDETLRTVPLGITTRADELIGVGLDEEGNPWIVAKGSQAARLNLSTGEIFRTTPAQGHNPTYYTYSDFTGYQHRNFTSGSGRYTRMLEGCPQHSSWKSVSWEATEVNPPATQLRVNVRVSNSPNEWFSPSVQVYGPFTTSPVDLSEVPKSTFMQLEFLLETSSGVSPILHGYEVQWACEPPAAILN